MKSCKLFVLWCKNSQKVFFVWNFTWQPWHFYYQHISSSAFIELHKVWALGLAPTRFNFCSKKFNYLRFEMKLMFASWRKKNYMQLDASVSFSCTNNISFFARKVNFMHPINFPYKHPLPLHRWTMDMNKTKFICILKL